MEKTYTVDYQNAIAEAMEDEAFLQTLSAAENTEQLKDAFNEKGIALDDEIAVPLMENLRGIHDSGELSEEMLEAVSGGTILGAAVMIGCGFITFYITVKVGCWIVRKLVK